MYRFLATSGEVCACRPRTAPLQGLPDEAWPLPKDKVAHLWLADLDQDEFGETTIDPDESERACRFKHPLHQARFVQGRSFLRHLAGGYLRCGPHDVRIGYGKAGKPRILHPASPSLHFNVAHCEETILIAFSTEAEIGVDVERERTLPDEAELVKRFFHAEEAASYHGLAPSLRNRGFVNAWTRKEAVLKAYGEGLQGRLDSFCVTLDPDEPCRLRVPPLEAGRAVRWTLCAPEIGRGVAAALAAMGTLDWLRVQRFGARTSSLCSIP
jgi:4'-phosphopantetheinyl transferase